MLQRVMSIMRLILIKFLFIGCLSLALSGCGALSSLGNMFSGGSDSNEEEYVGWDVQKFRSEAKAKGKTRKRLRLRQGKTRQRQDT